MNKGKQNIDKKITKCYDKGTAREHRGGPKAGGDPIFMRKQPEKSPGICRKMRSRKSGRQKKPPPCGSGFESERLLYYLLLRRQMCIFSASWISCSRKSGCATLISASAFCQVLRPFRFTMPYSVTK